MRGVWCLACDRFVITLSRFCLACVCGALIVVKALFVGLAAIRTRTEAAAIGVVIAELVDTELAAGVTFEIAATAIFHLVTHWFTGELVARVLNTRIAVRHGRKIDRCINTTLDGVRCVDRARASVVALKLFVKDLASVGVA